MDGSINLLSSFLNVQKEIGLTICLIYLNLVYCATIKGTVITISLNHPIIIIIITILSLTRLRICRIGFLLTLRDRLSWVNFIKIKQTFNLINLRASWTCNFCRSQGFCYVLDLFIYLFYLRVSNLGCVHTCCPGTVRAQLVLCPHSGYPNCSYVHIWQV